MGAGVYQVLTWMRELNNKQPAGPQVVRHTAEAGCCRFVVQ
jgi:hypothetical protein